jgi:acyl-homoserine-lactone acylase
MAKYLLKTLRKLLFTLFFGLYLIAQAQSSKSEILWDNYGVPHIYGKSTAEMYYAFGWSQMHSHANLILQLYGQEEAGLQNTGVRDMLT